jgi:hypothetical protein
MPPLVYRLALAFAACAAFGSTATSAAVVDPSYADDWSSLSPRGACMGYAGMKDAGERGWDRMDADDLAFDLNTDFEGAFKDQAAIIRSNPMTVGSRYGQAVGVGANAIGTLTAAPTVDFRRVARFAGSFAALPIPAEAEIDGAPRTSQRWMETLDLIEARAGRYCTLDFLALAYGIGTSDVESHYAEVVRDWTRVSGEKGEVSHYPDSFVVLNYLATRQRLARGDAPGAFALATDPVMTFGVNRFRFASTWVANFYTLGIGARRAPERAIALYDSSVWVIDKVEAATLKASLGRKAEAAKQLEGVLQSEWDGGFPYARAKRAYATVTGYDWREPPKPGLFDVLLAIPLYMIDFCMKNEKLCAASSGAVSYSGASSSGQGTIGMANAWDAMRTVDQMNAPVYKSTYRWAGACRGFSGQFGC